MTNVQSVVTPVAPVTNGATPPKAPKVSTKAPKVSTTLGTVAPAPMTPEQAIQTAFEYGASLAGLDGTLTLALKTFEINEPVMIDMLAALNVGYMMRKLGYSKEEATRVVNLKKHNDKKEGSDKHRTFEQQRVMDTVRVLWHRANKNAGTLPPKSENQVNAEVARAQKEAERKTHEARLEAAYEIVHPKEDVDVFESLVRLASTMKAIQKNHADKLVGDRGSAWRAWLASAPK